MKVKTNCLFNCYSNSNTHSYRFMNHTILPLFYIILCEYTVLSPNLKIRRLSNTFNQGQYDTNCHSFTPLLTYLCWTLAQPTKNSYTNYKQIKMQRNPKQILKVTWHLLQWEFLIRKWKDVKFYGKFILFSLIQSSNRQELQS